VSIEEQFGQQLIDRLNALIALQLDVAASQARAPVSDKVSRLLELGLAPKTVAAILGKPLNYVTAVTATKKKRESEKEGRKNGR
jgi:hypothetical protein